MGACCMAIWHSAFSMSQSLLNFDSFDYTKFVNKSCDIFLRWTASVFSLAVWCWFILDSVWTLKGYAMAPHLQTCARFASLCYLKMKWMGASVSHVWRCFLEPAGLVRAFRGLCLSENQNWRAKLYRMQWQKDKLCNIVFIYVSKYCMLVYIRTFVYRAVFCKQRHLQLSE